MKRPGDIIVADVMWMWPTVFLTTTNGYCPNQDDEGVRSILDQRIALVVCSVTCRSGTIELSIGHDYIGWRSL